MSIWEALILLAIGGLIIFALWPVLETVWRRWSDGEGKGSA